MEKGWEAREKRDTGNWELGTGDLYRPQMANLWLICLIGDFWFGKSLN